MQITILQITPNILQLIERSGRTCYKSQDRITDSSSNNFIKTLIKSGHESVLEHGYITIEIKEVSRALTHQLVRHRLCSFSQESQRYVSECDFNYIMPESIEHNMELSIKYHKLMNQINEFYKFMIENTGIKREDARYILPNATTTNIVMSCNIRQLRLMMKLRLDSHAQWEIRELFKCIYNEIIKDYPECGVLFEDLIKLRDK